MAVLAPDFVSALALARECDALFTTLRQPLEPLADALGLVACEPPFEIPLARAMLILRSPYGNRFERWLEETVLGVFG